MKSLPVALAAVLATVTLGMLLAQQAAPNNAANRYDAQVISNGNMPPMTVIVDHAKNTMHIYIERNDAFLEHQGSVDLSKAGDKRIAYQLPPKE